METRTQNGLSALLMKTADWSGGIFLKQIGSPHDEEDIGTRAQISCNLL